MELEKKKKKSQNRLVLKKNLNWIFTIDVPVQPIEKVAGEIEVETLVVDKVNLLTL